ncbi:MAG: GNAT family N-acetyltransferase [Roseburia sp.]|nr:GNAT family N-acetyltransferase [Anaeroplasma bactoclasticum]MCM1196907.1 GNAT family N-acetyltransferase [Roseburia sp.]MCM1556452.1 GNAT family N-acetyltransferase [Anaeroplasma bactoclasticum]
MRSIRLANLKDTEFLVDNDNHISYDILRENIEKGYIYILEQDNQIIGWLRYNLFWDNTPFLNMLYILEEYRRQGLGSLLLEHWENQMQSQGFETVLTSTLVHEDALHFYMKYGYQVVGGFHPSEDEYEVILKK